MAGCAVRLELWTDGSGTAAGPIGWAFVLRAFDEQSGELCAEKTGGGFTCEGTNNRAELTALLEGLRAIKTPASVRVFTDSEYVAKPFTAGYLVSWQERGWRKLTGGAVANADLWEAIAAEADRHVVEVEWVEGHAGVELNERCDRLAGVARKALIAELGPVEAVA